MKQFWFQIFGLIIVILGALWVSFTPGLVDKLVGRTSLNSPGSQNKPSGNTIRIVNSDGTKLKAQLTIEIADSLDKQSKGLGYRDALDKNSGMIFLLGDLRTPNFWMKGMRFPLDIIWIKDDEIVGMEVQVPNQPEGTTDANLPKYFPHSPINKVLEV